LRCFFFFILFSRAKIEAQLLHKISRSSHDFISFGHKGLLAVPL